MAGHMIEAIAIIHNIYAFFRKLVDDANNAALISRNGFGGKQKHIALLQTDALKFTLCKLRACGAALALASCHQKHKIFAGNILCILGAHHRRKVI